MVALLALPAPGLAQAPPGDPPEASSPAPQGAQPPTRQAAIEQEQAAKVPTLHPYVPNKAERIFERIDTILAGRHAAVAPVLRERLLGRRLHAGRRPRQLRERLQPHRRRAAATRSRATSASRSSSSRRGCSTAAASCRCSAAGARRRRSASTGSARTRRRTTARTTSFQQPYGSALFTLFPTRRILMLRGGVECHAVDAGARARAPFPSVETRLHAGDAARPRRRGRPICTRRARSASTGARRPATRAAAASSASRCTTTTTATSAFGFQQVDYEAIQHVPILREAWVLSFRGARPDRVPRRTASRSRSSCCRRSAAARRCAATAAGASATGTACCCRRSGASWSTATSTLAFFYDAGKVAARDVGSRPRRTEGRLRLRRPLPRPVRDAAARRAGQEPRRAAPRRLRVVRRVLRSASCRHPSLHVTSRAALALLRCPSRAIGLFAAARRRRSARASIRTIRSRASPSRRTRRRPQPYDQSQMYELIYNLFVTSGYKPQRPAREEHQHDRRGAGLELVHQPHRHQADHDRGARRAARTSARRPTRRSGC